MTKSVHEQWSGNTEILRKSSAQVETSVSQSVIQKSCELKLKPESESSKVRGVRFQAGEWSIIRIKARQAGISINSYIRSATLGHEYKPFHDPEWINALLAANRELTRQGNNLNQIAHKRNGNVIDEAGAETMLGLMARSYLQSHKAVLKALAQGKTPDP